MPKVPLTDLGAGAPVVQGPQFNLLFFGDFTRLTYAQFETEMEKVMNDPSLTYQAPGAGDFITLGVFFSRTRSTVICAWRTRRSSSGCSPASSRCCSPARGEADWLGWRRGLSPAGARLFST